MHQLVIICYQHQEWMHLVEPMAKGVPWTLLLKYYKPWSKLLLLFILEQLEWHTLYVIGIPNH